MKLSTKTRYGVRAMVEIAYNQGQPVLLKDISKRQRISLKYLDHIFSQLKTKGLINKPKAKKGGYLLARNPEDITLYEIIESLEGIEIVRCTEKNTSCPMMQACGVKSIWKKVKDSIEKTTKEITLKDIVNEKKKLEQKSAGSYTFNI